MTPYEEGGRAYCEGLQLSDNPYCFAIIADAWRNGWLDAEDEFMDDEEQGFGPIFFLQII